MAMPMAIHYDGDDDGDDDANGDIDADGDIDDETMNVTRR